MQRQRKKYMYLIKKYLIESKMTSWNEISNLEVNPNSFEKVPNIIRSIHTC